MKMNGNTILITGGSSGIGRALAHRFNDLGNVVVVAARSAEGLAETIGDRGHMHAITFDASDAADTRRFAAEVIERFPDLNILFNNAGIMRLESVSTARDLADTEETIAANLLGPIRLIDALVDHLSPQDDAVIVNVTSGLAYVPRASAATYSATKAAMRSYTVSLRQQLADKIEVIELAPPFVQTELTPGQSKNPMALPLDEFVDEVITLFQQQPTPSEILVKLVHPQRYAERDGKFDEIVARMAAL